MKGQILASLAESFFLKKLYFSSCFTKVSLTLKSLRRLLGKKTFVNSCLCTRLSHAHQIHQKFPIPLDKQVIAYWGFTCWPWETGLGQALSCRLQTNSCQELTMPKAESRRSLLSWETRCSQGTRNDGIWAVCIFQGHGAWKPLFFQQVPSPFPSLFSL